MPGPHPQVLVWRNLHFDFHWKYYYDARNQQDGNIIERTSRKHPRNHFRTTPLHLDQFRRCLELQEKKSLDPLQWCRNLSLCVAHLRSNDDTASSAKLVSILLRSNNVREVKFYLRLGEPETVLGFRLAWGLITNHLSNQKQLSVQLHLEILGPLSKYDYPFDALHESVTSLYIKIKKPLTDCIRPGELSQFKRLRTLKIRPSGPEEYSPIHTNLFWDELEKLEIRHLEMVSPFPRLTGTDGRARWPKSIRSLEIHFIELRDWVIRNPMNILRQLPNLESLSLKTMDEKKFEGYVQPDPDDDEEIAHPISTPPNCRLCQNRVFTTHALRKLHLSVYCGESSFRAVILASPLLEVIHLPIGATNDDLVFIAYTCQALKEVGFAEDDIWPEFSAYGLVFLCGAKTLGSIDVWGLQWNSVEIALEHWVVKMPQLKRIRFGYHREDVVDKLQDVGNWKPIERDNFLTGYGKTQFCCLEEKAGDILLPGKPQWGPEDWAAMKEQIYGFLKFDQDGQYQYIDVPAMRSELMSNRYE